MKRKLSLFLVILLAFFAFFFPSWIIQALAFLALFTLLLSYLFSKITYYNVSVDRKDYILRAHRYQGLKVRIVVANRGFIPIHFILVRDSVGALTSLTETNFFFGLSPGERRELCYTMESSRRGCFEVGPVSVRGADPLGFFPWEKQLVDLLRVVIYPKIFAIRLENKSGLPAGDILCENKIYEDITRYRSLREYFPGDDTRRINWKVSARLGDLYCTEFLPALSFPVLILLNLTASDFPDKYRSYRIERSIEAAASLLYYFIGLGQEVGLITTGRFPDADGSHAIPIGGSYGHAITLLEFLAKIEQGTSDFIEILIDAGLSMPHGTRIVVVSPPLKTEQLRFLSMIGRRGYNVELFELAGPRVRQEERFRRYRIKDYGDDLIEERVVSRV